MHIFFVYLKMILKMVDNSIFFQNSHILPHILFLTVPLQYNHKAQKYQ